jgi:hypothetical protein
VFRADAASGAYRIIANQTGVNMNGDVGIGTTSPAAKLHLVDSVESEIRTQYSTTSSGKLITGNGFTTIGSITNDPLVFVSNNTERMRFTNGGNLLLGTTTDNGSKFQVSGAATFSGNVQTGDQILIGSSATINGAINFIKTNASPVASRITFGTDGTGYKFAIAKNVSSTITDLFTLQDNGAATFNSTIQTAAPTGGTAKPWKLGKIYTDPCGVPTTFGQTLTDQYIEVEIDGVFCYIPIRIPGWC